MSYVSVLSQSLIKNLDFSLGTYRIRATIAWGVSSILSLPPPRSPFLSPWGRGRGQGEGEGCQTCSAAPALKPLQPVSIASRRRLCCPPTFP